MKQHKLSIFIHPLFLFCLALLILNDWVWKAQFGNELTGKLSDFAGLLVFPLFWTAFFPRFKKPIFFAVFLGFIWWKSPYSQAFIEGWNNLGFFSVARVVDYTDLVALLVLPFAYCFPFQKHTLSIPPTVARTGSFAVIILCSFAFMATSVPPKFKQMEIVYDETYEFDFSKKELQHKIFELYQSHKIDAYFEPPAETHYSGHYEEGTSSNDFIEKYLQDTTYLEFHTNYAVPILMLPDWNIHSVQVILSGDDKQSQLQLLLLEEYRTHQMKKKKDYYRKKLLKKFERKIVKKLRKD